MPADRPMHQLTPINGPRSSLEKIERRSQALLGKRTAARLVDKGEDSKEVAKLIDSLREAITHYQVGENRTVAQDSITHSGLDITTASDLPPGYRSRCKSSPMCAYPLR